MINHGLHAVSAEHSALTLDDPGSEGWPIFKSWEVFIVSHLGMYKIFFWTDKKNTFKVPWSFETSLKMKATFFRKKKDICKYLSFFFTALKDDAWL